MPSSLFNMIEDEFRKMEGHVVCSPKNTCGLYCESYVIRVSGLDREGRDGLT